MPELDRRETLIREMNVSEELVLKLTRRFSLLRSRLEGDETSLSSLFFSEVRHKGISEFNVLAACSKLKSTTDQRTLHLSWPIESLDSKVSDIDAEFWAPLLSKFSFEDTQFGITDAYFEDVDVFRMVVGFEGRIRDSDRVYGVKAGQTLDWKIDHLSKDWKISGWDQDYLKLTVATETLFEDVTRHAIPDQNLLGKVENSSHQQMLLNRAADADFMKQFAPVVQFFSDYHSLFQYPSVSVVDFDGDGHDDLFLSDRSGPSILLRNSGDGTFEDASAATGLELNPSYTNCALFADFDNDGDPDLLLGRSIGQCLYYKNEGGIFSIDTTTCRQLTGTRFVTSGAVADINRDGLLDVYLSTYATRTGTDMRWIDFVVPPAQARDFQRDVLSKHSFLDRHGPPNIVLMNRNGILTPAKTEKTIQQWRNSFQPVWFDFDDDGDSDLYVCNDFAPDALLRNDTDRGSFDLKFVDATAETFAGNTMGFGMGVSVGDYNSDGLLDLYLSNMYSKAGNRVIKRIGVGVDPRIEVSAKGNFLYRNAGKHFVHVAGLEPNEQHVAKVGWSFGGQFADLDNDSQLDLYVPSGFFTSPEEIDAQFDL